MHQTAHICLTIDQYTKKRYWLPQEKEGALECQCKGAAANRDSRHYRDRCLFLFILMGKSILFQLIEDIPLCIFVLVGLLINRAVFAFLDNLCAQLVVDPIGPQKSGCLSNIPLFFNQIF